MTETFGPLEAGQTYDSISIDYATGELDVWDEDIMESLLAIKFGVYAKE